MLAETPTGFVRVHCGTWRWQCDVSVGAEQYGLTPAGEAVLDAASDQLAA